jgi:AbrB family looped-hinge helix DNA binding protein
MTRTKPGQLRSFAAYPQCSADTADREGAQSSLVVQYRGNVGRMAIAHSRLTAQGQISVPAAVRRKLGLGPGSTLEWHEEGEKIVVRRLGRFSSADLHVSSQARPSRGALLSSRPA